MFISGEPTLNVFCRAVTYFHQEMACQCQRR